MPWSEYQLQARDAESPVKTRRGINSLAEKNVVIGKGGRFAAKVKKTRSTKSKAERDGERDDAIAVANELSEATEKMNLQTLWVEKSVEGREGKNKRVRERAGALQGVRAAKEEIQSVIEERDIMKKEWSQARQQLTRAQKRNEQHQTLRAQLYFEMH
jgi:hypothetical protein